jgi:uncharacterized cupredoxin-like copper-binding protein
MNLRIVTTTTLKLALIPLAALTTVALAPADQAGASTKATTVTAIETDFHIALSKTSFKPGTYIFDAKNKGQTTHALEITGPGLHNATTANIAPGKSAKLKVTFKSGKYDVFCPIPGHKALGMNVNLVISSSGKAHSTTATTKASSTGGAGF